MQTRVTDQPCIVLHTRAYRETSLIVSLLSAEHGRVSVVARGVRGARRGRTLQPFAVARAGWTGRTSLGTLTGFEVTRQYWLKGNVLACAFYLAELVMRLAGEREPHPRLFAGLGWALEHLESEPSAVLRRFEKLLLTELGYGLDFRCDIGGRAIEAGCHYRLVPDQGFEVWADGYDGATLALIDADDFTSRDVRAAARTLFQAALGPHLGSRPLLSRRLLVGTS